MNPSPSETIARAATLLRERDGAPWHLVLAGWLDSVSRDAQAARTEHGILRLGWCDDPSGVKSALDLAEAYLREEGTG